MDHFTETTTTSYSSNIGNSLKGILFGFFLIILSIVLFWYNENRSVKQATALKEMQSNIITLPDTKYKPEYNNKPILIQGEVKPISTVTDSTFGVISDGLVLQRDVTMYQWKEHKSSHSEDNVGGSTVTITTYDYKKGWHSHSQNSSSFKHPEGHSNPTMLYSNKLFTTDANIGDFHIPRDIVQRFNISSSYNGLDKMPENIGNSKNYKSFLYIGDNPNNPNIGDTRITYRYTPAGVYSLATKAQNRGLVDYTTSNGMEFTFIREGKVSADKIFKDEFEENSLITWILRFVGFLVMFIGFKLIMEPLSTLANVIPMFGSLVGMASSLVAFILTLLLGSIVLAFSWFASRPMMSLIIIGGAVLISMLFSKSNRRETNQNNNTISSPPPERENISSTIPPSTPPPRESRNSSTPPPRRRDSSVPPPRR